MYQYYWSTFSLLYLGNNKVDILQPLHGYRISMHMCSKITGQYKALEHCLIAIVVLTFNYYMHEWSPNTYPNG